MQGSVMKAVELGLFLSWCGLEPQWGSVIICARYVAGGPRLRDDGVITGPRRSFSINIIMFIHFVIPMCALERVSYY